MINNKTIAVIVPCFNEASQIEQVLETMPDFVDRIIVINDKSTDTTSKVIENYIQNNPNKSVKVKFSLTETAGLIDSLERNTEFSAYHTSEKQITKIKLAPYIREEKQVGFSYSVNKEDKQNVENKQSYLIGFYFNEARLLKEFLTYSLNSVFEAQRIEAIKKAKNSTKETKEAGESNQEDSELW